MVWLPVVERELRVAARKRATYRIRVLALLAVMGVLGWAVFAASQRSGLSGPGDGRELFKALAYPAAIFSILIGAFATSDCIGVEKREGTLGLLFLTDLKGYDVVFGKLVASSLNGFYALIAVLPVLGVPILVGGVTLPQFLEVTAGLVTAIVFSLSAGIFVSAFQQSERKAMFLTCALLTFVTGIPFYATTGPGFGGGFLWVLSPAYPVVIAVYSTAPGLRLPPAYWCSLVLIWLITFFMLSRASNRVPKSWQEKVTPPAPVPGSQRGNRCPNRQLLAVNPFAWLAARGEGDPRLVWLFLACIIGLWLLFLLIMPAGMHRKEMFDQQVVAWTDMAINTVLKIWIISEASRRFAEDRQNGGFELLLSTPLTVKEIIAGQWLALQRQFAVPIFAVLAWDGFLACGMTRLHFDSDITQHFVAAIYLVPDAIALGFAGMWLGLVTRSRNRAILLGVLFVLTLPWLVSLALGSTAVSTPFQHSQFNAWNEFFIWGGADAAVITWASSTISANFRRVATGDWAWKIRE
jgi:ABC-type transport system involved in multi-copper enzyme maturation permease subunit